MFRKSYISLAFVLALGCGDDDSGGTDAQVEAGTRDAVAEASNSDAKVHDAAVTRDATTDASGPEFLPLAPPMTLTMTNERYPNQAQLTVDICEGPDEGVRRVVAGQNGLCPVGHISNVTFRRIEDQSYLVETTAVLMNIDAGGYPAAHINEASHGTFEDFGPLTNVPANTAVTVKTDYFEFEFTFSDNDVTISSFTLVP